MRAAINFCQVCGQAMTDRWSHGRMRRVCPSCGFIHFEDPKVAVTALVEHDDRVLLIRRAMNPERGKWALPGGYVDYGEDPREAAQREVREETGLEVEITRLVGVRGGPSPYGGPTVIIDYAARVTGGTAQPLDDAAEIGWYAAADPLPEIAFDSTRDLLATWQAARRI